MGKAGERGHFRVRLQHGGEKSTEVGKFSMYLEDQELSNSVRTQSACRGVAVPDLPSMSSLPPLLTSLGSQYH